MFRTELKNLLTQALDALELPVPAEIKIDYPDLGRGDYSSNLALVLAKERGQDVLALAEKIKEKIFDLANPYIAKVEVVSPGFINFFLSEQYWSSVLKQIISQPETFGHLDVWRGQKVMIEYTDTNPFKEFHIGHLMSNTVGEALARLYVASGAEVKRACYQGDVGLNVAKALWGVFKLEAELPKEEASLEEKIKFLGRAYAFGARAYEDGSDNAKEGITIINKKVYKRSDPKLNEFYDLGRRWSLEHFETIYKRLGTQFDFYFFESEIWPTGQKIVEDGLGAGIFEKSDGAIVFCGEKFDPKLHTRVFINSNGLTTYEAKDLGLAKIKHDKYHFDLSLSITGQEQIGYFRVVLAALKAVLPELAPKVKHLAHGILCLPSGKMSSREGNIVTAESLLSEVKQKIFVKIKDHDIGAEDKDEIAEKVAVGAIKYSILKQSIGKDVVFDFSKSLSFDGDSGPYLQYAYVRALSILNKIDEGRTWSGDFSVPLASISLVRLLPRWPEVVASAFSDLAPQQIVSYLILVASAFNNFYAKQKIIGDPNEDSYLALTKATAIVLERGLDILGLPILTKM